ncbi:hybrid sensor histidine kinase/response regulator [Muricoccus aerilatus]|uniref:hybrid sensor histidine kinase/response regulator n=1 Tax=Muricoccus aerilatus TaxID=452982 RepID=UPI000A03579D|nr:PAS domain-containing protein [Roseomonas aerilata]
MSDLSAPTECLPPTVPGHQAGSEPPSALRLLAGPFLAALDRSGMSVVVTDPQLLDNPVVYVNPAFTRLTGYTAEEALGRNCRFLQVPETDPAAVAALSLAVREGRPLDLCLLNARRDGTRFWNAVFLTPIPGEGDAPRFFLATQTEITPAQEVPVLQAALRAGQEALSEANQRLREALLASDLMAAWDWDVATRRITGDARFARLYGLTPEEAARGVGPGTFFSVIHPEDRPRVRLAVGAILRGADLFSKEYRVLLPGGAMRWVHARGRCYAGIDDRPARFVGTLVDISEQKRVQERLRIAQTAGGIGTFEYVAGYGTASVSERFCALLGLRPATDLPLRTINAIVHPGDPQLIDAGAAPAPGTLAEAEFRIRRPDTGETRWLTRRGEYLSDPETAELRFCGVIYDITETKLTEARLRTLNERLEAEVAERTADRNRLWRLSADIMLVARPDGLIVAVNPAWTAVLGWSEAELVGRQIQDFIHPDHLGRAAARLEALARGEALLHADNLYRHKNGSWRWVSWSAASGEGLVSAVGRDVTAERDQAEALRLAEDALRQAQKMEAVGQLTGGIAHDFNNLLAGIVGSLQMTRTRIAQGRLSEVERYLVAAEGAASRAAALTHRLLAFSRQQTLDPRPTQPNSRIREIEDLVNRTMGPGIEVRTLLDAGLWPTLCDANQLENALLNLCINARDAMPEGGRLTIETANAQVDERTARGRGMAPGQYVTISVADTGQGMAPEVVSRAFEPFFTTKPIGKGTGLGLSMIYGFARQSGGHVAIHSEVGRGTTMRLYLPRHLGEAVEEGGTARMAELSRTGTGETVLVVDDEVTVRMLVVEVLEELGYTAIEAADGPTALEVLRSPARIDLLITDVGLPGGMNGRQVADAARVTRPGLNVLFITGYAENAVVGGENLEPGMHFLTKPFGIAALANRIRAILAG